MPGLIAVGSMTIGKRPLPEGRRSSGDEGLIGIEATGVKDFYSLNSLPFPSLHAQLTNTTKPDNESNDSRR